MSDSNKDAKRNFDKWYKDNKEEYNRKRRERYASDKKYRKRAIENSERYRKEGAIQTRGDSGAYRKYKGVQVRTFRIGEVSKMIQRSAQTIRQWEIDKLIPRPVFKDTKHRIYTEHQAKLLSDFADVTRNNRDAPKVVLQAAKRLRGEWRHI